jgi:tetratricopeptide (TPR) repeat protein
MTDTFYKRINYFAGLLTIGVVFGVAVLLSTVELRDLDLWLHLGMGKFILQNGYVPAVDILSSTIVGAPWTNHEWLFQIFVYSIYSNFGPDGLISMQVAVVTFTLLILLILGYDRDKQLIVAFSLLLVILVFQVRFTYRPDLFSLLFFALFIYILSLYIHRPWSLYALVIIQVIWSNMHGFFFFGPLFVLIGVVSEWTKRHVKLPYEWNQAGRLTDDEYNRLKIILIFVVLACLINPLTFKGAWYPIRVFFELSGNSKIFFQYISELQPPILMANIMAMNEVRYYKILILISSISFFFNRRNIDIGGLIFWLIFLVFSLKAIRNIPFFAFAAYLVIITNSVTISLRNIVPLRFTYKRFQYITLTFFKILLIFWIVTFSRGIAESGYFDFDTYEKKSDKTGVSLQSYPHKAVDFLVENKILGNTFNDFNSGAYLVGRVFPDIKVFIDGRTEVYGPEYFKKYLELYEKDNQELFDEMVEKYNITIALFSSVNQTIPENLLLHVYDNKTWVPVYFDFDGLIFLKDVPQHKDVIEKHRIDLTAWKAKEMDLYKLGAKQVVPTQHTSRAFTLIRLKLYKPALLEIDHALKIYPGYMMLYKLAGKAHAELKNYQTAFENFRIASILDPNARNNRYNLAQVYYDLGQYNYAVYQYDKLIKHNPKEARSYFLKGRALIKDQKYEEAVKVVREGHVLDMKDVKDLFIMGEMLEKENQYAYAQILYEMALTTKKREVETRNHLGRVYQIMGEEEKAAEEFKKALQIDPNSEVVKNSIRMYNLEIP